MRTKRQQAEVKRWYWNRRNLKDWLRMAVWRVRSNGVMALRSGLLGPPFGRGALPAPQAADDPRFAFLSDPQAIIESTRLRLIPFQAADLNRLIDLFEPSAGEDPSRPRYWTTEYILAQEMLVAYHSWIVELKSNGECIGHCGLTEMDVDSTTEQEIGYRIGGRHQGQGYATEAAAAVRDFLFRQGVTRVISAIAADNIASQRVALKNGMRWEKRTHWQGRDFEIFAAAMS